jgi:hypothetical protein
MTTLLDALRGLVDRDLSYHGNEIRIPCDSHGDAIARVRIAREAINQATATAPVGQGEFFPLDDPIEQAKRNGFNQWDWTPNPDPKVEPEQHAVAASQSGYCKTCNAGPREFGECEMPDCVWVPT